MISCENTRFLFQKTIRNTHNDRSDPGHDHDTYTTSRARSHEAVCIAILAVFSVHGYFENYENSEGLAGRRRVGARMALKPA